MMLRMHLVQMLYKPAYFTPTVDYLQEPSFWPEYPLGTLRHMPKIAQLLDQSSHAYLEHLSSKVEYLARWSAERGAHLLVFPEYSIPAKVLPALQEIAARYSMCIVAGSHKTSLNEEIRSVYKDLGVDPVAFPKGHACCPIIMPSGKVTVVTKKRASKWDQDLETGTSNPEVIEVSLNNVTVRLSTILCVDLLHPEIIGKLWQSRKESPHLIICPSLSPSTKEFDSFAPIVTLNRALVLYVNGTVFGGTSFNVPPEWKKLLRGIDCAPRALQRDTEAILELDIDPLRLPSTRPPIDDEPIGCHPIAFAIVYAKNAPWLLDFNALRDELQSSLECGDVESAREWLDIYLLDNAEALPGLVGHSLKYLRNSILPRYTGDSSADALTKVVVIPDDVEETSILWSRWTAESIRVLTEYLQNPSFEASEDVWACLRTLKQDQKELPMLVPNQATPVRAEVPSETELGAFQGEENLVAGFQNRGTDIDALKACLANDETKVVVISGALGIGKSDFINLFFRKTFTDWEVTRITVPMGGTPARVLVDIASMVGLGLDLDLLASSTHKVFRQKVRDVFERFYTQPKRALVIDDLCSILRRRNVRDHNQLEIILEEAAAPRSHHGGRVFMITSSPLPSSWLARKGVRRLHLNRMRDIYIRRVIEHQMRREGLVKGEEVPEIPQPLLDLVRGHPLSAKLCAEVLGDKDVDKIVDEHIISEVASEVARHLLQQVSLTTQEKELMEKLSVFRFAPRLDRLERLGFDIKLIHTLSDRAVLSFDGVHVEMHEAIRRFFYEKLSISPRRKDYHQTAVHYYEGIYEERKRYGAVTPSILAELAHHLTMAGEIQRAEDFKVFVVEEIKPAAREIYRSAIKTNQGFDKALSLYRMLEELTPNDPAVVAYVGRCYARLQQWAESDKAFQRAIEAAETEGIPTWWIHRDWGHIKARFRFYKEAEQHFDEAEAGRPRDPSIISSRAYIRWHQGKTEEAESLFKQAYDLKPDHAYTLKYYAKFCDDVLRDHVYANALRKELTIVESGEKPITPEEYELDADYDDL